MTETYLPQALIAPNKYVQGRGLLSSLGKYVEKLGTDALVIADESVWGLVHETVNQSFAEAGVRPIEQTFGGECSKREIERLRGVSAREGASVVLGIGGGKANGHRQGGRPWRRSKVGERTHHRFDGHAHERAIGDLHRRRRIRGVHDAFAQSGSRLGRHPARGQRAGEFLCRGNGRCPGNVGRGAGGGTD